MPNLAAIILGLVVLQRISELILSARNTKKLISDGSAEYYPEHYPLIIIFHASWIVALAFAITQTTPVNLYLLLVYVIIQFARYYIIVTLAGNWTTRILRHPNKPLVTQGIYKYVRHPNYAIVAIEIFLLPFIFGMWRLGLIFGILNLLILCIRIHFENKAIQQSGSP